MGWWQAGLYCKLDETVVSEGSSSGSYLPVLGAVSALNALSALAALSVLAALGVLAAESMGTEEEFGAV